MSVTNKHFV